MEGVPHVELKEFNSSIHGRNLCISCHNDAADIPHPGKLLSVDCGSCHKIETEIYLQSDHGRALSKGISVAAVCTSCHGKTHTLLSFKNPKSPVHRKNIPQTCAACHANPNIMSKFLLTEKEPFDTYLHSVHGQAFKEGRANAAICSDCHGTHDLHGASNQKSKVFRSNTPNTCGRCHENVRAIYERSIHGRAMRAGIKESPVCTDCHGEHVIRAIEDKASSVYAGAITKTCANCHASEKIVSKFGLPSNRLKTFQDSYHGLASRAGDLRVANCSSCHGWHNILPSYDTQSSIHPINLPKTCGKCHPGAQQKMLQGKIHGEKASGAHFLVSWVKIFYLILIPLIVGGMLVHNFLDYLRKMSSSYRISALDSHELNVVRMNANERIQHGLLVLTFLTLAYSGFALKFPESWWATPFQFGNGEIMRKSIHRWTALIFVLIGTYHCFYMTFTRRGRLILIHRLFPKLRDFFDPFRLLAYNLGFTNKRPKMNYPSYIEKSEYWALLWGSAIMVVTGMFLAFNNYTLKYFPLWVSDLSTMVHYYEAILACLSILVWHSYWVIFDPDVYPMNRSWFNGSILKK